MNIQSGRKSTLMLIVLVLTWGISWSIYKMALAYSPPLLFAGLRSLFGGAILALFLLPKARNLQWRRNWRRYAISALLNTAGFYGLQNFGLSYMPAGLFSVLVYFQPILIGLFAWLWLGEKMTVLKVLGLILGFVGIVAVSADGFTGELSAIGIALGLLSALCWALGVIYVKKESKHVDAMWMVAAPSFLGGIALTAVGSFTESWAEVAWNGTYWAGLGFGATFGVPITFVIYYTLVNQGDASKVATFTFLVPLIAVLAGTVFMNEPFTYSLLVGLALIVLSICFVNRPSAPSLKRQALETATREA
ncbi:DMT family transporter [Cohnella lubricantis]|uniref:DMT family transporter n=1 Tax=Cohnella lubricantis TaxID=2163172 RepID=A0A841TCZ4_9BACL|nr:DMT family transporter [Cohnella lubricantis]MBB6677885.1 DMT family transporter [Cohnella lubricantis]MBP2119067.1 drug/metabolite transporter (DMT)-like permease [Cohnella lubricantis]